jgi:hypothetical protein
MGADKDFTRWLKDYEVRRLSPDRSSRSRLNWRSTKYDIENMSWQEVQNIYLPEIESTWGFACNYLRKLWYKFKMQKREGERGWDTILDISRILYSMGLPLIEFHDGPDIPWIKAQLDMENRTGGREMEQTSQDVEAKYEEDQEQKRRDSWSWGQVGDGEPEKGEEEEEDMSDVSPEERELYITLRKEELADEKEQRDQNVRMILEQLGVTPREEEDMDSQEIEEEETDEH